MKRVYFALLLTFFCLPLAALENDYPFGHLSLTEGLNSGTIYTLLEDHNGILWIGTESGLCCYDGFATLNVADNTSSNGQHIQSSIIDLKEDGAKRIWAKTYNNTYTISSNGQLIEATQTLQELGLYHGSQYQVYVDEQGDLWNFCTDSVFHLNIADNQITGFAAPQLKDVNGHILSIAEIGDMMYVINSERFFCFDTKHGTWQQLEVPAALAQHQQYLQAFTIMKCYADKQGGLWIFSMFDETIVYRPSSDAPWQTVSIGKSLKQNSIRAIREDSEGNIWIATDHEGIFLYQRERGVVDNLRHTRLNAATLAGNNINCLVLDSHNTMWVGHYKSGISYHHPMYNLIKQRAAETGEVTALLADEDGTVWIGTNGEGMIHQRLDNTLHNGSLRGITVTSILKDSIGAIWIGSYNQGLFRLFNHKLTRFTNESGHLPHDNVTRMLLDPDGKLWICSIFGSFYRFDTQNYQYEIIKDKSGDTERDLQALSLCYNPNGRIHVGTVWGLWSGNTMTLEGMRRFGLSEDRPFVEEQFTSLYFDAPRQLLWMSHRQGVSVFDQPNDTLYELTPSKADHSPQVFTIIPDNDGNIWFNTYEGISVATPIKEGDTYRFQIRTFTSAELQQPQLSFNSFASAKTIKGTLLFGCTEGYCEIDPKLVLAQSMTELAPTFIIARYENQVLTEHDLSNWNHNSFPIHLNFYSGNPLHAASIQYEYRIMGISEIWQHLSTNQLELSNLPWGENVEIQVRACGNDGVWSEPKSIFITTDIPLSRTPLMIAFYVLITAAIIGTAWRIIWIHQRRKTIRRHRQKLHEQHAVLTRVKLQQMSNLIEHLQKEQLHALEYIEELKAKEMTANNEKENTGNNSSAFKHPHLTSADEDFIQRCISISEKNLADSSFGVEELGQTIGMSRSQLYKRFMAITGRSPLDVIRSVRMKRAKQLIDSTELPCSDIAQLVGYNTLKTFTENFKQEYKITPIEYQRSLHQP